MNKADKADKADKAESLFRTGYNCSQSVYAAFAEELGITVEEAAKKASPFGAGFGKLREVCGAVTGMVMVIGDLYGYDDPKDAAGKKKLYALVQKLCGQNGRVLSEQTVRESMQKSSGDSGRIYEE